jgi:hypothetical protein
MTLLIANEDQSTVITVGETLTITSSVSSTGHVDRWHGSTNLGRTAITASQTKVFGPYLYPMRFNIVCQTGSINFTSAEKNDAINEFAEDLIRAELAASSGSSLVGFIQSGTGAVARDVEDKLRETITPFDFGAAGDGVTDDTAALQAVIDNYKREGLDLSTPSSAASALAGITPVVIDLAGKDYTISASLDFSDLYYVTFSNGRIIADDSATWASDFMLYIAKPQETDIYRDMKIRNLTFENMVIDGNLVANCVYLENTYEVTISDSIVIGWKDGGYGVRTSQSLGTPITKNTHLKLLNVTASQKELASVIETWVTTSGTAISIRTYDCMLENCAAYACDVAIEIDDQISCQLVNCHTFTKASQYCLKLGENAQHVALTNFFSDTGIVEIRSFAHTFSGCLFTANSTVRLIATSPNETSAGLIVSSSLFSKQPEFLTEGDGTWSAEPKSEWLGNRTTTGAAIRGMGRVLVCRGNKSTPSIRFNDVDVVDVSTGFYSPGAGEVAYSANNATVFTIDSYGSTIYGHDSNIGVGGANPKVQLHGLAGGEALLASTRWNTTAGAFAGGGGQLAVGRSRSGVIGSYAALENGDGLGRFAFFGDNGTDISKIGGAIRAEASGNWAAASSPTNVIIQTVPSGSTTATDRLKVESNGDIDNLTGVYKIAGTQVVGPQDTGWTASTGTPNKAAYATYAGQTASADYVQAEAQATDDAAKANSQRIKAIEDAMRTHGLIN